MSITRHRPRSSLRTRLGLPRVSAWRAWRADGAPDRALALTLDRVEILGPPRNDAAERGEIARRDALFRFVGDGPRDAQQFAAQPLGLGGEEDPHLAAVVV